MRKSHYFPKKLLVLSVSLSVSTWALGQGVTNLKEITVTASHTEQDVLDVANTLTVLTTEDIERLQASDIKDLLRYEAGVSVKAQPMRSGAALSSIGRGGNEGINIRGLEGNQVMLQTDGVRLPAIYTFGPMLTGRGDYLEPEGYKRVEVLRGPSSTLYGSEGLAGAVSFVTKDPIDLLTLGQDQQVTLRAGYASEDKSHFVTPAFAARNEKLAGMLLFTARDGEGLKNQGSVEGTGNSRTLPNPQDKSAEYWLAKLVYDVTDEHQIKLTAEKINRLAATDVLTGVTGTTTGLTANDRVRRDLYKTDYVYQSEQNPWLQYARVSAYQQDSSNRQFSDERRSIGDRTRDNAYAEQIRGLNAVMESNIEGQVSHRINYGVDLSVTDISALRNGDPAGTSFPDKPFPDTDYRLFGVFVQDEMSIGRLSIIPGLRYDSYKLSPSTNDPLYQGISPVELSDSALSAKMGLVWKQAPLMNWFAQYSEGFRAPTPGDVNSGFTNLSSPFFAYRTIANPDLKPESSKMYEVGLRGRDEVLSYSLSLFRSDYKNFIENAEVSGTGRPSDPLTYQSVNRDGVEVTGIEASLRWKYHPNWALSGTYAKHRGHRKEDGEKVNLDTIDPAKLVAGLHFDNGRYGSELIMTHVEAKTRNSRADGFNPGRYTTFDLLGNYQLSRNASLQAGIFNLTDESYTHWADVRSLDADSQVVDAFTQPGRNFKVSFTYQF